MADLIETFMIDMRIFDLILNSNSSETSPFYKTRKSKNSSLFDISNGRIGEEPNSSFERRFWLEGGTGFPVLQLGKRAQAFLWRGVGRQ